MKNNDTAFFGHPRGLSVLFFTEMWERFSYYGTRAILILFMTAAVTGGGLGFDVPKASAIYGMYAAMVYLLSLPGGWIADRFLGQQRAVMLGGIFIAAGNAGLAIPSLVTFYTGLGLISIGTGLLKPNVSTIVGQIYKPDDLRRDAGFSIFYMGINTGALISPFICGYLGERVNWHFGFAAASFCMVLGLIQYAFGRKSLGDAGLHPVKAESAAAYNAQRRQLFFGLAVTAIIVAVVIVLAMNGTISVATINSVFGLFLALIAIVTFSWLIFFMDWTSAERKRLIVVMFLFLASVVFWSIFEQAGSTLNLFAERNTDLHAFGFSFPASFFQAVNSIFLVIFAPILAWVWLRLGKNDLSSPVKFGIGLIFVSLGVLVLIPPSHALARVSPLWLTTTYLLHTIGELCLSPVGLSAMTKLAPTRIAGLTMGVWFLSVSIGNYNAGKLSGMFESMPLPTLFFWQGVAAMAAGLALLLMARMINRLMGGVK